MKSFNIHIIPMQRPMPIRQQNADRHKTAFGIDVGER